MAISPQRLTIYLYSAHRAVIFAIAQLSCCPSGCDLSGLAALGGDNDSCSLGNRRPCPYLLDLHKKGKRGARKEGRGKSCRTNVTLIRDDSYAPAQG